MPRTATTISANTIDPFTELVTTQRLQHEEVMKEIGTVKEDVHAVKNGMEARVVALEIFRQTKAADEKITRWDAAADIVERFADRWKFVLTLWGMISGFLGFVLAQLIYYLLNFKKGAL